VCSLGQSSQFVHNLQHPLKASDVLVRFHLSAIAFVAVSGIGAAQASDLVFQGRYVLAGLLLVHRQTLRLTGICVEVQDGAGQDSRVTIGKGISVQLGASADQCGKGGMTESDLLAYHPLHARQERGRYPDLGN
jgi:hypothetical protein